MTDRIWCQECGCLRDVAERSVESMTTASGEFEVPVVRLDDCDHVMQGPQTYVTAAPGAPWAGPDTVTAPTSRPSAVARARAAQDVDDVDPWD